MTEPVRVVLVGADAPTEALVRAALSSRGCELLVLVDPATLEQRVSATPFDLAIAAGPQADDAVDLLLGTLPVVAVGQRWSQRSAGWLEAGLQDYVADPGGPTGAARLGVAVRTASAARAHRRLDAAVRLVTAASAGGMRRALARDLAALGVRRWQLYRRVGDGWGLEHGSWRGEGAWSGVFPSSSSPAVVACETGAELAEEAGATVVACRRAGKLVAVLRCDGGSDAVVAIAPLLSLACAASVGAEVPVVGSVAGQDTVARIVHAMRGHLSVVMAEAQLLELGAADQLPAAAGAPVRTILSRAAQLAALLQTMAVEPFESGDGTEIPGTFPTE